MHLMASNTVFHLVIALPVALETMNQRICSMAYVEAGTMNSEDQDTPIPAAIVHVRGRNSFRLRGRFQDRVSTVAGRSSLSHGLSRFADLHTRASGTYSRP